MADQGYLIDTQGTGLIRRHQQVACITYTNVASNEITSRTDGHPAILSSTIHSFCWSLIKNFQPVLRELLPQLPKWPERLEETAGTGTRRIDYDLGYPTVRDQDILLGHNDVLSLAVLLMGYDKFRRVFVSRYPILLVDEYQDTDRGFAEAVKTHFLSSGEGPLVGFFGDHWQKIYGTGCGQMDHPSLAVIGKHANFRSVAAIVDVLNRIRADLHQEITDPDAKGSIAVYHTNEWVGERRTGGHWGGDLPAGVARTYLAALTDRLATDGWDMTPQKTKILMLTHNILAEQQGYSGLAAVFPSNEMFIKKEDDHVAFLVDVLEPVCGAYQGKRYGEMFEALGSQSPAMHSHADKAVWARDMDTLLELRSSGTIGAVLDHLRKTKRPRLPDALEQKERKLEQTPEEPGSEESSSTKRLRELRTVPYQEVVALSRFIDGHTPFSTKHGVKGAEFENVLVVFGRGWNLYNFNQFLEWAGGAIPPDKQDAYERNRNLFYVVCSRPTTRLALMFTQQLSDAAVGTLAKWFGRQSIHPLHIE